MKVRNKKTGAIYEALYELGDQTNGREGIRMVVYRTPGAQTPEFVRDAKEFASKFDEVDECASSAEAPPPFVYGGPYCPDTNAACVRMCQSICNRRAASARASGDQS